MKTESYHAFNQLRVSFEKYRHFLSGVAIYSGSTSLSQAIMIVYAILLARVLGPEEYGTFVGTYSIISLSSIAVNWGMDNWLLREAAEKSNSRLLSAAVLINKALLGLVWGGALVIALPLIRPGFFFHGLTLLCVLDVWGDSCFNTLITALNVDRKIKTVSRLMLFTRSGRLVAALIVIMIGSVQPVMFAFSRATFTGLGFLLALLLLRPDFRAKGLSAGWPLLRRSLPFGISDFLAMIYMQADVTLLSLLSGKIATGLYSPASNLINALFVVPAAGYMLLVPRLTQRNHASREFRQLVKQVIAGFCGLGLVMAMGVGFFGGPAVGLVLGNNYQMTSSLLVILSPILLLKSIEFGLAIVLVVVNWQQQRLVPQVISALVNVLLNIMVIPIFHVYGVAVVYVISEVVLTVGYALVLMKWFRQTAKQVVE